MKQKQSPVKRAGIISKSQVKSPAAAGSTLIRVPKMAEVVADHIRGMIVRADLKEGDFLVPEAQLMQQFGTSRPTIREAFRILEGEQFITITRGSRTGAKVTHPAVDSVARMAGFVLQCQGTSVKDIYDARLAIEPRAAFLAAKQADRSAVEGLKAELEALRGMFDRGETASFRKAVARFHQSVVALSDNHTLMLVFAMLVGVLENHQGRFSAPAGTRSDEAEQRKATQAALRSMDRLISYISNGEADLAEAHWRRHIENANKAWLAGHDQTIIVDVLS